MLILRMNIMDKIRMNGQRMGEKKKEYKMNSKYIKWKNKKKNYKKRVESWEAMAVVAPSFQQETWTI